MKHVKKLLALALSALLIVAMSVTAFAAGTGSITITNANKGETYTVYKVFDADGNGENISYKLTGNHTDAPAGFDVDDAGNVTHTGETLTATDIAAIANYVVAADKVDEKTADSDGNLEFTGLANGYYYITTTTGTVVTITSTNPDASVTDKNEAPVVDKKITAIDNTNLDSTKALAQVGSVVTYTATIDVKAGAENYVFHDVMSNGLSYNNDLSVKVDNVVVTNYTTTTAEGDTITIAFNNDWIATQAGKTITITYTATVTSDALTQDPATNSASLTYGNNQSVDAGTGTPVEIYNAKITVTKVDGSDDALAGAGFVLKKGDKYYKLTETNGQKTVSWVDSIDDATELTTTEDSNVVVFSGLVDGTYTLVEKTVPAGYNKAEDETITISAGVYTTANLEQTAKVVNKAGTELPSTGGMGTTMFYVFGGLLVVGAGVVLVTRKRMHE